MTAEEVKRLGALAGLELPEEDLEPLAEALAAHTEFVEPILSLDAGEDD